MSNNTNVTENLVNSIATTGNDSEKTIKEGTSELTHLNNQVKQQDLEINQSDNDFIANTDSTGDEIETLTAKYLNEYSKNKKKKVHSKLNFDRDDSADSYDYMRTLVQKYTSTVVDSVATANEIAIDDNEKVSYEAKAEGSDVEAFKNNELQAQEDLFEKPQSDEMDSATLLSEYTKGIVTPPKPTTKSIDALNDSINTDFIDGLDKVVTDENNVENQTNQLQEGNESTESQEAQLEAEMLEDSDNAFEATEVEFEEVESGLNQQSAPDSVDDLEQDEIASDKIEEADMQESASLKASKYSSQYNDIYFPPHPSELHSIEALNQNDIDTSEPLDSYIGKHIYTQSVKKPVKKIAQETPNQPSKLLLKISGMSDDTCVERLQETLINHAGVHHADVSLETSIAKVQYDDKVTNVYELIAISEKEGYLASEYDPDYRSKKRRVKKQKPKPQDKQDSSSHKPFDVDSISNVSDYFVGTSFGPKKTESLSDEFNSSIQAEIDNSELTDEEDYQDDLTEEELDVQDEAYNEEYIDDVEYQQYVDEDAYDNQDEQFDEKDIDEEEIDSDIPNEEEDIAEEKVSRLANRFSKKGTIPTSTDGNESWVDDIEEEEPFNTAEILKEENLQGRRNRIKNPSNKLLSKETDVNDEDLSDEGSYELLREAEVSELSETERLLTTKAPVDSIRFEDLINDEVPHDTHRIPRNLLILTACALPFIIAMVGTLVKPEMLWIIPVGVQFVIATVVQFVLATPFYRNGWHALKSYVFNMDLLVVLTSFTTWLYSSVVWWLAYSSSDLALADGFMMSTPELLKEVCFEAGVIIITLVSFVKFLEVRTKKYSLNGINVLKGLIPEVVDRQSDIGDFYEIDIDEVESNDILQAKQGDRIACDGIVVEGDAWCDESHLTGESRLVSKAQGDSVLAGAMVENGSILYRVNKSVEHSKISEIIDALSHAQTSRSPISSVIDKVAAYFVPMVIILALVSFVICYWVLSFDLGVSLLSAVAILITTFPFALGLATPTAVMAGMGIAAKYGVWFKDTESLEEAGKIDTVVMDKTGTLTEGKPTLVAHLLMNRSLQLTEVLQLAASIENHVDHPLATALVHAARQRNIRLLNAEDVAVVSGRGIEGEIEGVGTVKVGTLEWVKFPFPENMAEKMHSVWQSASIVAVSVDDVPLGAFAFADDIRNDAQQMIQSLREQGINVVLMSGDKESVVSHIGEKLGIDKVFANMTPRDKAGKVIEIKKNGHKVAMVGDSMNDALAMSSADVSFSLNKHIDDDSTYDASVRLMGSSLMQLYDAHQIANATVKTIKQNLMFAFISIAVSVPLAFMGWINPVFAGFIMALTAMMVLINAIRLKRYSPRKLEWV